MVCARFLHNKGYRDGHLRVINALPYRHVLGVHVPDMKRLAEAIVHCGSDSNLPKDVDVLEYFESASHTSLCYEETVVWGLLINLERCSLENRLLRLERYIPVLDNWAVCDTYCAHAKWMKSADKAVLWAFVQSYFLSNREFEVRFAIVASMTYFLNEEYLVKVFNEIDKIHFEDIISSYRYCSKQSESVQSGHVHGIAPYYVRMGVAWLLATSLAKYPEQTRCFVRTCHLPDDVIRLYMRKSRESFRTRNICPI